MSKVRNRSPEVRPVPLVAGSVPQLYSYWSDPAGTVWLVTGAFAVGQTDRPDLILCEAMNRSVQRVDREEMVRTWKSSARP